MSTGGKIAAALGALITLGVLVLVGYGLSLYDDEVCTFLKENDEVSAQLGLVSTCELEMVRSIAIKDVDTFVFALSGSRGNGRAYVRSTTDDEGRERYLGISLEMGSEEVVILGERPPH